MRINRSNDYLSNPPFFERPFDQELLKNVYDEPEFLSRYRFAVVSQTDTGEANSNALAAWFRTDYLDRLDTSGSYEIEVIEYLPTQ